MVLVAETEVLGAKLPRRQFVHHKSHLSDPSANPGRLGGKPATNRLSYGAAIYIYCTKRKSSGMKLLIQIYAKKLILMLIERITE
jgi:hypothetical protein